jgi:hypothetical protein
MPESVLCIPAVRVCGIARDFGGNELSRCIEYYTGEVWEGPVTGETTQPACEPSTTPVSGWFEIVVGDDGTTVTGSVTEQRPGYSCGGTAGACLRANIPDHRT